MKRSAAENGCPREEAPVAAADGSAVGTDREQAAQSARGRRDAARRGCPGPDPLRPRSDDRQAGRGSRHADVGRSCRRRGQHLDRTRLPSWRALVRLGRLSHRCGVGTASLRIRLRRCLHDPDGATAVLGVLVAVGVLATAGRGSPVPLKQGRPNAAEHDPTDGEPTDGEQRCLIVLADRSRPRTPT